ncbi:MAG: VanZ family protein, partial [bacterium]|nr:VanZ family protein [bacterium]
KKLKYNKRILKINLIIYLLLYTMLIFSLTLFDEIYGRQGLIIIRWNKSLFNYYSNHYFNMIPFKTINLFIKGYAKNIVTLRSLFINVIGNFLIFMPYSIFLPLIFKNKKYFNYLIIMLIYIITIEFLQFITMSGSCDIDDLILNISGFSVIFLILKNNIVYKYINKIFLLEDDA